MHFEERYTTGFYHGNALLQAGQAADLCDLALTLDTYPVITGFFDLLQDLRNPLARPPVQAHGGLDVIERQARSQGDALGCDDIAQLAPLSALDLNITLGDQALQVPVDGANRHAKLRSQARLGDIRVMFDFFQQDELADGIGLRFCGHIQNSTAEL